MFAEIKTLKDVVDWGLCTGCGACAFHCETGGVKLVNIPSVGIRPQFDQSKCTTCSACLKICPSYEVDANANGPGQTAESDYDHEFGVALEIWEGYAADPITRRKGSSGGVLSALASYSLEAGGMKRVIHTGAQESVPWLNETVESRTAEGVLRHAGSRYAPASPCEGLGAVETGEGQAVFIGKPCDVAAVAALRKQHPRLDQNLGIVLTFFCAGTPSTDGTKNLFKILQVDPSLVKSVHYRGDGWPGMFRTERRDRVKVKSLTYEESWKRLTGYRPLRCNLCPDGLGRLGDISCGDAWHHKADGSDNGRSLIIVRTERGRELLRRAMAANYVVATRTDGNAVMAAQANLLRRRRELFGRLLGLKMLLIPTPRFVNFSLATSWSRLPFAQKCRTVFGTLWRAATRRWWSVGTHQKSQRTHAREISRSPV